MADLFGELWLLFTRGESLSKKADGRSRPVESRGTFLGGWTPVRLFEQQVELFRCDVATLDWTHRPTSPMLLNFCARAWRSFVAGAILVRVGADAGEGKS